jgi:hypothetical protein
MFEAGVACILVGGIGPPRELPDVDEDGIDVSIDCNLEAFGTITVANSVEEPF